MPLHGERQLVAGDAGAVVGHPDAPDAAPLEIHVDLGRARVERVLEELLQRRGRALDDLARGDLIDEVVGQRLNPWHGKGSGKRERNPMISSVPETVDTHDSRGAQSNRPTPGTRLAVSLLLMTIGGSGMYSVAVVLAAPAGGVRVARGDASLPYTLTMIGFGFGGILMGRLSDRFGVMVRS
jgi:hypothetical protein